MPFLFDQCTFKPFTESLLNSCKPFVCEEEDINDFFENESIEYSKNLFGKTYCFTLDKDPSKVVCAFTVSNDSIKANLLPNPTRNRLNRSIDNSKRGLKSYPAVLIGKLGVAKEYEGQGIGRQLMDFIKSWFVDTKNKTGCRYIVVDSYTKERPINYYKGNKFEFLFDTEEQEKEYSGIKSTEPLETRLMRCDLIYLSKETMTT